MAARFVLAVMGILTYVQAGSPADDVPKDDAAVAPSAAPEKVQELIRQLGSTKYVERERARKELEALGPSALEALRQAVKHTDAEISRRAGELVQKFETRLQNEMMLAPKRVRLQLKDTPVPGAVAELARQSGYDIQVAGDRTALAKRKVTLDTGETTFWEALDGLCREAGLVEHSNTMTASDALSNAIIVGGRVGAAPAQPFQPNVLPRQQIQPALPAGILPVQPPKQPINPKLWQPALPPPGIVPPVQVQFQPAQPAIRGGSSHISNMLSARIVLADGKPADLPTCYAGAVRLRARPERNARAGEAFLVLEVSAEPRLQNFRMIGSPHIARALDEHGQSLSLVLEPAAGQPNPNVNAAMRNAALRNVILLESTLGTGTPSRQVPLRFKSDKAAKTVSELSGSLSVQALGPTEAIITVGNILKAEGKTAKNPGGGSLEVHSVDRLANGDLQLKITWENLSAQNPAGLVVGARVFQIQGQGMQGQGIAQVRAIQFNGNRAIITGLQGIDAGNYPKLVDARGQPYALVSAPEATMRSANGQTTVSSTLVFRSHSGQGDPAQLILYGQRPIGFNVPFTFANVPLP